MAEVLALDIGSWLTTKLIDSLAEHFLDDTGEAVFGWSKSLRKLITSSIEYRAIAGDRAGGTQVDWSSNGSLIAMYTYP